MYKYIAGCAQHSKCYYLFKLLLFKKHPWTLDGLRPAAQGWCSN